MLKSSSNSGLVKILEWITKAYHGGTAWRKKSDFEKRKEGKEIAQNRFIHTRKKKIVNVQLIYSSRLQSELQAEIMFCEDWSSGFFVNRG